jgi:hypothetical protein
MSELISFKQAYEDSDLLGGVRPWPRQLELLDLIACGDHREAVLALGRRSGKNFMSALWATYDATLRDLTRYQRPGERRYIACVGANREQSRLVLTYMREILANSPLLADALVNNTADELSIRQPYTGALVVVRALPCSSRAGRGLAVSTLICDEIAHWTSESEGFQVASRVYNSLTPSTAQFGGDGRVILISTPAGRSNHFFDVYERSTSGSHADMFGVCIPTWDINEELTSEFYASEQAKDPISYRQEFGAEFMASGSAFLEYEKIIAAVDPNRFELAPDEIVASVAAFDASFSKDPAALAILGRDPDDRKRLRLALVRSWRPDGEELGFSAVLDEVARECRRFGVRHVVVDQHASVPVREHLQRAGVWAEQRTATASSRTAIFSCAKALLYSRRLELYRHEELLDELSRLEVSYAAGGAHIHIPRARGSHGDMAVAVAMAAAELADSPSPGPRVWPKLDGPPQLSAGLMEREF